MKPTTLRDVLLLLLAATSGYVDAVSYLGLGHVFTSNMTGNTVLLGLALGQRHGLAASRSAVSLAGFIVGVALGSALIGENEKRVVWPGRVAFVCAIESAALLAFAIVGILADIARHGWVEYVLIALSAITMGLQSAAVRTLGVSGVTTTYITGTWTSMVSGLAARLRALRAGQRRPGWATWLRGGVGLQAAVVSVYGLAALAAGIAEIAWRLAAILLPAVAVAIVAATAALRLRTATLP